MVSRHSSSRTSSSHFQLASKFWLGENLLSPFICSFVLFCLPHIQDGSHSRRLAMVRLRGQSANSDYSLSTVQLWLRCTHLQDGQNEILLCECKPFLCRALRLTSFSTKQTWGFVASALFETVGFAIRSISAQNPTGGGLALSLYISST